MGFPDDGTVKDNRRFVARVHGMISSINLDEN